MTAGSTVSIGEPPLGSPDGSLGVVPDTVRQVLILSRYQFRDYLRSRRFILMLSIVAAVGVILTTVIAYFRPATLLDNSNDFYGGLWAGGATFLILFAGIIFGGDAIAGEFQNKTGYFLMGLPVRRATVYVGKYLAVLMASVISIGFYLAILFGNGAYYLGWGAFSDLGNLAASICLALLYLLALMGFVFFFSSLFKTSTYAVLVVAVLFLFAFSIVQAVYVALVHAEPWFMLSYANGVIAYPLTGVQQHIVHTVNPFTGARSTSYNPTYVEGIGVMLLYWILTSVVGLFLFEREEFT